jgi:hypothetical protein
MFEFFDGDSLETEPTAPGQLQFDARGNAIYAWRDGRMQQDGMKADQLRQAALSHPELKLIDDTPVADAPKAWNDTGLQVGYNPYESGLLAGKKPAVKKTDIRELSRWIELQRRLGGRSAVTKK